MKTKKKTAWISNDFKKCIRHDIRRHPFIVKSVLKVMSRNKKSMELYKKWDHSARKEIIKIVMKQSKKVNRPLYITMSSVIKRQRRLHSEFVKYLTDLEEKNNLSKLKHLSAVCHVVSATEDLKNKLDIAGDRLEIISTKNH